MLSSLLFGGEQHCCKPNNSLNRLPTRDNPWAPGSLRDAPGYTHCLLGSNQQKYETVLGQMSICPSLWPAPPMNGLEHTNKSRTSVLGLRVRHHFAPSKNVKSFPTDGTFNNWIISINKCLWNKLEILPFLLSKVSGIILASGDYSSQEISSSLRYSFFGLGVLTLHPRVSYSTPTPEQKGAVTHWPIGRITQH